MDSRKWWITHQAGIYNGSGVRIGEWNPYVAAAGHKTQLKPVLNYRLKGWTPDNYDGQYQALSDEAVRLQGGRDPITS